MYNFVGLNNVRSLSSFGWCLFSICSYGMSLTVGIILVNLCCSFSSFDISFTMCGDPATMANSKWGLTYVLYNLAIILSSGFTSDICIIPNILLAVSATAETCFEIFRLSCMMTPKSFFFFHSLQILVYHCICCSSVVASKVHDFAFIYIEGHLLSICTAL